MFQKPKSFQKLTKMNNKAKLGDILHEALVLFAESIDGPGHEFENKEMRVNGNTHQLHIRIPADDKILYDSIENISKEYIAPAITRLAKHVNLTKGNKRFFNLKLLDEVCVSCRGDYKGVSLRAIMLAPVNYYICGNSDHRVIQIDTIFEGFQ